MIQNNTLEKLPETESCTESIFTNSDFQEYTEYNSSLLLMNSSSDKKAQLIINTLGPVMLYLDEKELDPSDFLKRRRIQDLLILLIIHRKEGLHKEIIFDMFWENYTARSKKDNLNTLIYRLKKLFGNNKNLLLIDRNWIRLNMDFISIDTDLFMEGVKNTEILEKNNDIDGAIIYARKIIQLYKGDFFESLSTDVPIDDERSKLKNFYLALLFRTLRLTIIKGLYRESLEIGRKLIACDPYCEPAYRLIMSALGYLGNTSEITRLYIELDNKLWKAYKIPPDEKTLMLKSKLALGVNPAHEDILNEVSIFF